MVASSDKTGYPQTLSAGDVLLALNREEVRALRAIVGHYQHMMCAVPALNTLAAALARLDPPDLAASADPAPRNGDGS